MILYHPAFDHSHAVFRNLFLLEKLKDEYVEQDKLRILEFVLLFPNEVKKFRIDPLYLKLRNKIVKECHSYQSVPSIQKTFYRLEPQSESALKTLTDIGLVERHKKEITLFKRTNIQIPEELRQIISNRMIDQPDLTNFVFEYLAQLPLKGENGLKDRSKLLPQKYG